MSPFEYYLRTGRRIVPAASATETKFNPWHDPDDGRFTFAGQGRHFPGRHGPAAREGGRGSELRRHASRQSPHDPKNPRNYSIYRIKRGDTLSHIARQRKGLTAADLIWLNELSADRALRIGQKIKLPHQLFLDRGKRARDTFLALAHYIDATGGKLPPNVARPPSIALQVESAGLRAIRSNGYAFDVDVLLRSRRTAGELQLKQESRSRKLQADAGKPDRRATDDGGHFIAARFNGPRQWFNYFAQDANFNRGSYRALEDKWAKAIRSGKRVFVDIVPHYRGTSMRPYKLTVVWYIGSRKQAKDFHNEKGGQ